MFWKNKMVILGGPVLLALGLAAGLLFDLFRTTFWYDIVLHFLGGAVVVVSLAGAAWHLVYERNFGLRPATGLIRMLLAGTLLAVAVVWEAGEVLLDMTPNWTLSKPDTVEDVIYALIGGAAALPFIRFDG